MSVLHRPNDVLRTPRRVAAEENAGERGLHRRLVHHRHAVLVEIDPDVALDPRKRVVLPDRQNDFVAGKYDGVEYLADLPPILLTPFHALEFHPDEFSILDHEPLGRVI